MADANFLRQRCLEQMEADPRNYFGGLAWLREAFMAIPREHFVPTRVWWPRPGVDGLYKLIDRDETPNAWLKAVYRLRTPLVTQIDDGAVPASGPATGWFTSSISCITVVIEMLRHLAPRPGERILEIGTGTGYSSALLAHRTGPGTVTSIEIDPHIAAHARQRHSALGADVHTITGDGELGHPAAAPYDRIVSMASVRRIPPAWLRQLRPGGVLVVPLDTPFGWDLTVLFTGTGHGAAVGRPVATVEFMRVRGQRGARPHGELGWPADVAPQQWRDYEVRADQDGQLVQSVQRRTPVRP